MGKALKQHHNETGLVKVGELIDIRQAAPLTLQDRRIYSLLVAHAHPDFSAAHKHRIPMSQLRGPNHRSGDRVRDSIERLMTTLVRVQKRDEAGRRVTIRAQLLAGTSTTDDEDDPNGYVSYSFLPEVCDIIQNSDYWGRVRANILFAFSSKYSIALYEAVCLRRNLKTDNFTFTSDDFRDLLGVDDGNLTRFPDFKRYALDIALREVNALSDYNVEIEVLRVSGTRSAITGYRLRWAAKSADEWHAVMAELDRPRVGRKARIAGKSEQTQTMLFERGRPASLKS